MNAKRIYVALIAVSILIAQTDIAGAQEGKEIKRSRGGWGASLGFVQRDLDIRTRDAVREPSMEPQAVEPHAVDPKKKIVGTWLMTVPESEGAPGFSALQPTTKKER